MRITAKPFRDSWGVRVDDSCEEDTLGHVPCHEPSLPPSTPAMPALRPAPPAARLPMAGSPTAGAGPAGPHDTEERRAQRDLVCPPFGVIRAERCCSLAIIDPVQAMGCRTDRPAACSCWWCGRCWWPRGRGLTACSLRRGEAALARSTRRQSPFGAISSRSTSGILGAR